MSCVMVGWVRRIGGSGRWDAMVMSGSISSQIMMRSSGGSVRMFVGMSAAGKKMRSYSIVEVE